MRYHEITESFDQPEPFKWEAASSNQFMGQFTVDAVEYRLIVSKDTRMPSAWSCVFGVPVGILRYLLMPQSKQFRATNKHHPFRVFSTVIAALQNFLTTKHPACFYFMAKDTARQRLYSTMLQRLTTKLQGLGYQEQKTVKLKKGLLFLIANKPEDIDTFIKIERTAT